MTVTTVDAVPNLLAIAEERARLLRQGLEEHLDLLATAVEEEDWRTLEYDSVGAWYADVVDIEKISVKVRRRLIVALRGEGQSLRAIATTLQTSKDTVQRELRAATGEDMSQPATPDRVTGADGKSYPATRPLLSRAETQDILDRATGLARSHPVNPDAGPITLTVETMPATEPEPEIKLERHRGEPGADACAADLRQLAKEIIARAETAEQLIKRPLTEEQARQLAKEWEAAEIAVHFMRITLDALGGDGQ